MISHKRTNSCGLELVPNIFGSHPHYLLTKLAIMQLDPKWFELLVSMVVTAVFVNRLDTPCDNYPPSVPAGLIKKIKGNNNSYSYIELIVHASPGYNSVRTLKLPLEAHPQLITGDAPSLAGVTSAAFDDHNHRLNMVIPQVGLTSMAPMEAPVSNHDGLSWLR